LLHHAHLDPSSLDQVVGSNLHSSGNLVKHLKNLDPGETVPEFDPQDGFHDCDERRVFRDGYRMIRDG